MIYKLRTSRFSWLTGQVCRSRFYPDKVCLRLRRANLELQQGAGANPTWTYTYFPDVWITKPSSVSVLSLLSRAKFPSDVLDLHLMHERQISVTIDIEFGQRFGQRVS